MRVTLEQWLKQMCEATAREGERERANEEGTAWVKTPGASIKLRTAKSTDVLDCIRIL